MCLLTQLQNVCLLIQAIASGFQGRSWLSASLQCFGKQEGRALLGQLKFLDNSNLRPVFLTIFPFGVSIYEKIKNLGPGPSGFLGEA